MKDWGIEQFNKYVMPVTECGCWIWLGYVSENGYGRFCPRYGMTPLYAHRVSYELYKKKIPEGFVLDHVCRIRCCVNPDHLEIVTQKENLARGIGTSGESYSMRDSCKNGHSFSGGRFYLRSRTRICLICDSKRSKAKYRRLKNARA